MDPESARDVSDALAEPGTPLDAGVRAEHERRLGQNLGDVRVHYGDAADRSVTAMDAVAYTTGSDIVFGAGRYAPGSGRGDALLAHELTHVAQQRSMTEPGAIQRGMGELRLFEAHEEQKQRLKLDFAKAKKGNGTYAKSLGWGATLATVAGGKYKVWADLWNGGSYDAFATEVAGFQIDNSFPDKDTDGILGPATWYRILGPGEAMASLTDVKKDESTYVCTIATEERIKRGHQLATGRPFELTDDKSMSLFTAILQSNPGRMLDVDVAYRGAGAAGAMVYAGKATFVSQADIWNGGLQPGAVLQVWGEQAAYDILRAGQIEENGKMRRITDMDANYYGTSFVFVRYDTENPKRMLIRHYDRTEWKDSSDYAVWIAANISSGSP